MKTKMNQNDCSRLMAITEEQQPCTWTAESTQVRFPSLRCSRRRLRTSIRHITIMTQHLSSVTSLLTKTVERARNYPSTDSRHIQKIAQNERSRKVDYTREAFFALFARTKKVANSVQSQFKIGANSTQSRCKNWPRERHFSTVSWRDKTQTD